MAVVHSNKLGRSFFIKNKKQIQKLFNDGSRIKSGTFKTIWTCEKASEDNSGISIFISVPKRLIGKANKRNLLKRRIKEALRLNLADLKQYAELNNCNIQIGVVYSTDLIVDYKSIESKIILSLQKIHSNISGI